MKQPIAILGLVAAMCMPATAADTVPRDTSFTVWSTAVKVRKKHPGQQVLKPELPKGVTAREEMVYCHFDDTPFGARDLHADVYRPEGAELLPAVIMIHGGGWNSGDKTLQRPMAQRLAARGYVAIPIEYRLIPEALYPAGLHDVKTAIRWVRSHADSLGVDPDRIAVWGCSAGAQLATLAGVTNGSARHEGSGPWADTSSDVQAIVNLDGIATFVSPENIADSNDYFIKRGTLHVNATWLGGLYLYSTDNWNEASAINWVTDRSAPACFINSTLPRYCDGCAELRELYRPLGIHSEHHVIDVDVHPFWFFHPWADEALDHATSFLDSTFKTR